MLSKNLLGFTSLLQTTIHIGWLWPCSYS